MSFIGEAGFFGVWTFALFLLFNYAVTVVELHYSIVTIYEYSFITSYHAQLQASTTTGKMHICPSTASITLPELARFNSNYSCLGYNLL